MQQSNYEREWIRFEGG